MKRRTFLIVMLAVFFLTRPVFGVEKEDARAKAVHAYVHEFVGDNVKESYPKIGQAIENVFMKLPDNVFRSLTDRSRPVIFVVNITAGIAKYANAVEFDIRPEDPPTFQKGFYLIKLGDDLEDLGDVVAIEGVVAHELAHRYLEHLKVPFSCDIERQANQQAKDWGFGKEYLSAKETFGSKTPTDSPCHDHPAPKKETHE